MSQRHYVAVDLGASSGRVMLASHHPHTGAITLEEVSRCVNQLVTINHRQCWDLDALEAFIIAALEKIGAASCRRASVSTPGAWTTCC